MQNNGNWYSIFINNVKRKIAKIPGLLWCYVSFRDLIGLTSKYDSGFRHLKNWLSELNHAGNEENDLFGKKFLFYSDLPYWVNYSLALSVLIIGRGASIDFAWQSNTGYRSRDIEGLEYTAWGHLVKKLQRKSLHRHLNLVNLSNVVPAIVTDEMRKIAAHQALMDTSYVLLKESVDIDNNPFDKAEYEFRYMRNLDALRRLSTVCNGNKYDRLILPSGAILEFGAIFSFVKNLELPTSTYEFSNNHTLIISNGASVMGMDASDLWVKDSPHVLTDERRQRVQQIIENRQRPAPKEVTLNFFQLADVVSSEEIKNQLGIESNKPIILMCPNCPFDAAYYVEGKKLFLTMVKWLVENIQFLIERNDCHVIVRCHPAERFYQAKESTESIIRETFLELPDHIQIIKPDDPISTYSIMNIADIGLVYWSTTGLEMAMRGIPVVSGVPSIHYNCKGFTLDPQTLDEYFQMIDKVIKDPSANRLTKRQIELSWCYADIFFNDWPKPFPWALGERFWFDIKEWPISRMLSDEGKKTYGNTLSILTGECYR